jgi:hypothetical protein
MAGVLLSLVVLALFGGVMFWAARRCRRKVRGRRLVRDPKAILEDEKPMWTWGRGGNPGP